MFSQNSRSCGSKLSTLNRFRSFCLVSLTQISPFVNIFAWFCKKFYDRVNLALTNNFLRMCTYVAEACTGTVVYPNYGFSAKKNLPKVVNNGKFVLRLLFVKKLRQNKNNQGCVNIKSKSSVLQKSFPYNDFSASLQITVRSTFRVAVACRTKNKVV